MSTLLFIAIVVSVLASLLFATLAYALRDYSRARLQDYLEVHGRARLLEPLVRYNDDLVLATATGRLVANVVVLLCMLRAFDRPGQTWFAHYVQATTVTVIVTLFGSVAIPHAIARRAAETVIGVCARPLLFTRAVMIPFVKLMQAFDNLIAGLAGGRKDPEPEHIEQEILSVIEEGQKEGVVDQQEREMIVSVIEFRDTQVGQIMTARPEIVAIELHATLAEVKRTLEESGHSRLPVFDGTLDHIVGMLYARDLIKHLGLPAEQFDVRDAIRPAIFVPETKPLKELLREFRQQKVHIAVVADEYGGTAGLVTIEDILEELVGEISDEHEPQGPSNIRKLDERTFDADARMYIGDVNRRLGLHLPDDAGYETLGGFISVLAGRIPPVGAVLEHDGVKYTVAEAEPQKVNVLRIELPAKEPAAADAPAKS